MLREFYTEIPVIEKDAVFLLNEQNFKKLPFSLFHFSTKVEEQDLSQKGYVEYLEDHFLSGRHVYFDRFCIKGGGISKFYKLKKERALLGGMTSGEALRETVCSLVLSSYGPYCSKVIAWGYLKEKPEHFFIVRDVNSDRLGLVSGSELSNKAEKLKKQWGKYNKKPEELLSLFIKNFFDLLYEGVLHTSVNEFNVDIEGRILDCEGFYLGHNTQYLCIPVTVKKTDLTAESKEQDILDMWKNGKAFIDYVEDYFDMLDRVLIPLMQESFNCGAVIKNSRELSQKYASYTELKSLDNISCKIIDEKEVRGELLVYSEVVVPLGRQERIKNKEFIRLALNKNFQSTLLSDPENGVKLVLEKLSKNKKTDILRALREFVANDLNIEFACVAGSIIESRSSFEEDSDIDLCLKVKGQKEHYRAIFKKFFRYNVDLCFFEELHEKKHLAWHFKLCREVIKGKDLLSDVDLSFSEFTKKNFEKAQDLFIKVRAVEPSEGLTFPSPENFFYGYLVPYGRDIYSLRYLQNLAAHYAHIYMYRKEFFCSRYYVKDELILLYLDYCSLDPMHSYIREIYDFILENGRLLNVKSEMSVFKKLVILCEKALGLEQALMQLHLRDDPVLFQGVDKR